MSQDTLPPAAHPPGPREFLALALTTALALGLRAWGWSGLGIDHFDEGIYAFSGLGLADPSQPHRIFPRQYLFSPPVYIGLIAGTIRLTGLAASQAAVAVNIVLGTLSVPVVWWLARRWFGPVAAIIAAILLAGNEFHVALSRSALTDVAFLLAFVVALGAVETAVRTGRIAWAVAAGLAVGIAWNTKYHGWFAIVIGTGALAGMWWRRRMAWPEVRRTVLVLAVAGVVAGLCYLPWAWHIQLQPGGYAGFAEYQRSMLRTDWIANLVRQAEHIRWFEGPLTRASPLVAAAAGLFVARASFGRLALPLAAGIAAAGLLAGGVAATAVLGLAAAAVLTLRAPSWAAWIVAGWIGLWILMTPLYYPYARLVLPFVLAVQIAAAAGLARLVGEAGPAGAEWSPRPAALFAGLGVAVGLLGALALEHPSNPWHPSRSVRDAVQAMLPELTPGTRVLVFGEPVVSVYLHEAGWPALEDRPEPPMLDTLSTPAFIVAGIYTRRVRSSRERLAAMSREVLTPLGAFPMSPKDLRLLDDTRPSRAWGPRATLDTAYALRLYRFTPGAALP